MNKDITIERESLCGCMKEIAPFESAIGSSSPPPMVLGSFTICLSIAPEQNNLASQMPDRVLQLEKIWQKQTDDFTKLAQP